MNAIALLVLPFLMQIGPCVAFSLRQPTLVHHRWNLKSSLRATTIENTDFADTARRSKFDMGKALFCAGLAFDAYVEPPSNSSRWEKGSNGMNVAFVSPAYTRNLYKGFLELQVQQIYDLPDDDNTAESIVTGGGVDAYLLVAAVEGQWKEDVIMLEKEAYHEGVLGLQGAAHVGRSRTAWANINENQSKATKRKAGVAVPYHIRSTWGKGGQAVFTDDEPPFYLYIQDPATSRLVFTVMDDDVIGDGSPIGSAHVRLTKLIPDAKLVGTELLDKLKQGVIQRIQRGEIQNIDDLSPEDLPSLAREWKGEIKLSSKPRVGNKNGQVTLAAAAGAMVAGPVGAAAGALLGALYEGEVRGRIQLNIRYLPIPPVDIQRAKYVVKGGLPGVDWGEMYKRWLIRSVRDCNKGCDKDDISALVLSQSITGTDLEHCFFINHDVTGGCCSVYRSLEKKVIVVSFRGTCVPKDLVTDASLAQDAWVQGEDVNAEGVAKVHTGFRKSLNSISRRLKELILAIPAPDETLDAYSMYVTGHSLGGALATLFTLDIAEFGVDAGRALPQKESSDNWWKGIASTILGTKISASTKPPPPPRPKALYVYNFGSPRVGNRELASRFGELQEQGHITEAYRVVNGDDVVARSPRTINALAFGHIGYDHCAATVLVSEERTLQDDNGEEVFNPTIWIEGESDNSACPVRDGTPLISPLADGSLLSYIFNATQESFQSESEQGNYAERLRMFATKVTDRLQTASVGDVASIVGIDQKFAEREIRMIQSLGSGVALNHHMEDSYYSSLGRASGFVARVGEELKEVPHEQFQHL
jgi:Lipase (class 3)